MDRTEKLFPILENAGYAHVYACGPRKKHGSLIAFREDKFALVESRTVFYDDERLREHIEDGPIDDPQGLKASSRVTKNVGNIVALRCLGDGNEDNGVVVATTHLFWHPR